MKLICRNLQESFPNNMTKQLGHIYILLDVALQVDLDNAYRTNKEEAMKCFRDKSHPMIFIALSRA